jgi:hypothetical protein
MDQTIQNNERWMTIFKSKGKFIASFDANDVIGKLVMVSLKPTPSKILIFFVLEAQNGNFLTINLKKISKNDQIFLIGFSKTMQAMDNPIFLTFLKRNLVRGAINTINFKKIDRMLPIESKDYVQTLSFLTKDSK